MNLQVTVGGEGAKYRPRTCKVIRINQRRIRLYRVYRDVYMGFIWNLPRELNRKPANHTEIVIQGFRGFIRDNLA